VQFSANRRGTVVKLGGQELVARPALLPDLVAKYQKLADAKKELTRVKVSRALGWPVTHRIEVPEGADVASGDAMISIATPYEVTLTASVDEDEFVNRLGGLNGGRQRLALEAFDLRSR
jgi:hypothetical protein